jgi:hypothetical protein
VDRSTSESGDCGKLVVKRESNSGIAGGYRGVSVVDPSVSTCLW